jgi:hypothetical protein
MLTEMKACPSPVRYRPILYTQYYEREAINRNFAPLYVPADTS